ncbi:MOSC domain-containing protein [Streptomyces sp. NPDC004539]|uniref:MOSC domain-containing protein n=1 Tax=Streptomyces sp. NPDC004539 TaxID=3154280 RepID=UPI0033A81095
MGAVLRSLHRYPVKGMTGEELPEAVLAPGAGLPLDRAFALHLGAAPVTSGWISSEELMRLRQSAELSLYRGVSEGDGVRLTAPGGRELHVRPGEPFGSARLVRPGAALWDWPDAALSIVNLDTVRALSEAAGVPLDPARFRANLYVSGLGAWRELALPGHRLRIGGAELEVTFPTERCRATSVRPGSGVRDLNVPALLATRFGHLYCGVYAKVVRGGRIASGDALHDLGPGDGTPDARLAAPGRPRYAELIRRTDESPTVTTFTFRDPAATRPGQHLRLHLTDEKGPLWRCYTLTGADSGELSVSVKRTPGGRMSATLHTLPTGSRVLLSGPYGEEPTRLGSTRPLLLAVAGIGITPVLSLLRALPPERPVTVLNVVRDETETPLWDEVITLVGKLPHAEAHLIVGRPDPEQLTALIPQATGEAYLCGPEGFVDLVRTTLLAAGVPPSAITDERFYTPREVPLTETEQLPPSPGPFAVHYTETGTRITWTPDSGTLLDAAEAVGLRPASACRAGACGTCRHRVTGTVAHLGEPAVQLGPGEALLCCAVPVGDVEVHGRECR